MRRAAGISAGSTKRATSAAATRPAIEYRPSWASPGRPEKRSAAKPAIDVATPSRIVGQESAIQASPPALSPRPACTKRKIE